MSCWFSEIIGANSSNIVANTIRNVFSVPGTVEKSVHFSKLLEKTQVFTESWNLKGTSLATCFLHKLLKYSVRIGC